MNLGSAQEVPWEFTLYVAGQGPKSLTAYANIRKICEEKLTGRYKIEVIDLAKKPHLARDDQIVAVPALVRKEPLPVRKLVGDLSNRDLVLVALNIP